VGHPRRWFPLVAAVSVSKPNVPQTPADTARKCRVQHPTGIGTLRAVKEASLRRPHIRGAAQNSGKLSAWGGLTT
jgi:hypothetical protein